MDSWLLAGVAKPVGSSSSVSGHNGALRKEKRLQRRLVCLAAATTFRFENYQPAWEQARRAKPQSDQGHRQSIELAKDFGLALPDAPE